jgi:hypothetical protein
MEIDRTTRTLTVVALSDPVLYPSPFGNIQDLTPIFVMASVCTGSTSGTVSCETHCLGSSIETRTVDDTSMLNGKTLLVGRRC